MSTVSASQNLSIPKQRIIITNHITIRHASYNDVSEDQSSIQPTGQQTIGSASAVVSKKEETPVKEETKRLIPTDKIPFNLDQGLKAIWGIDKRLSAQVQLLKEEDNPKAGKVLRDTMGGYLKNITTSGAFKTAGVRMGGPLTKRDIDYRGTAGQLAVIKGGLIAENENTRIDTLTGEGPKDSSIHVPTGTIFSNVADPAKIKTLIHWNTDPVDGTNPTSEHNILKNGQKGLIAGGVSIALYAIPKNKALPAFTALPDELSIWGMATSRLVPKTNLTLEGDTIEEIVEKNVKMTATAVLKERLKRDPTQEEYTQFLKNEFKVVLMNRPFQNIKILQGLKNAGIPVDLKIKNGKVDFSDWAMDGDSLPSEKHYKKGNICIVGDGNVSVPFMKDVYLLIGNSGGPEFLQLLPSVQDLTGVFLSKEKRDKDPLEMLITGIVKGSTAKSEEEKKNLAAKIFTPKDLASLKKYGFDLNNTFKVFTKENLISNSDDYTTAFTAITPLQGGRGTFDIPGMEAVKIDPDLDTAEISSILAHSSGAQYLIKEKFQLSTKRLKEIVKKDETVFKELSKSAASDVPAKYTDVVREMLTNYIELAKLYITFGCFDASTKILDQLDGFIKTVEIPKMAPKKASLVSITQGTAAHYRDYLDLTKRIYSISAKDLSNVKKLDDLKKLKIEIEEMIDPNITPYLDHHLGKDLKAIHHELSNYIKKLTDKLKAQEASLDATTKVAIQEVREGKRAYQGLPIVGANLKTATPLDTQIKQIEAYIEAAKRGVKPQGLFFVAPAMPILKWAAIQTKDIPSIKIAAQTVHVQLGKENTGETIASHLKELGIQYAMVGHLEERKNVRDSLKALSKEAGHDIENAEMGKKVSQLIKAEIAPILCIGDVEDEKPRAKEVLRQQLEMAFKNVKPEEMQALIQKGLIPGVAYEPAWAIGTVAAEPKYVEEITKEIRLMLIEKFGPEIARKIAVMYGGSVSPANVKEFASQPNINGSLVGGASYGSIATEVDPNTPKIFAISHAHQKAVAA